MAKTNGALNEHRREFGCLIHDRRLAQQMSQADLAEALNEYIAVQTAYPDGIGKQTIHTWEAGRSYPPRTIDAALCFVLDIDPSELVFDV